MTNQFVKKLSELAELTADDMAALEAITPYPRRYVARQDLIREGDEPGPVFVVLEGWACRYKILPNGTRQIMAFLMPGDSCDLHVTLLAEMDHSIQAITAASVATIPRAEMQKMMQAHPNIAKAMYTAQLVDEGVMRAWIVSMGRRSAIERVAHLVCELYLRTRNIGLTTDDVFALPLSQLVLADALGMTAVHINRVLKELRQTGAMALARGNVTILARSDWCRSRASTRITCIAACVGRPRGRGWRRFAVQDVTPTRRTGPRDRRGSRRSPGLRHDPPDRATTTPARHNSPAHQAGTSTVPLAGLRMKNALAATRPAIRS